MKLPRNLSGDEFAMAPAQFGYEIKRQKGSHIRLTTQRGGEHHVTIPRHDPLRIGTLRAILDMVAGHLNMSREELQQVMFDQN